MEAPPDDETENFENDEEIEGFDDFEVKQW